MDTNNIAVKVILGVIAFVITFGISYYVYNHHIQNLNQQSIKYRTATCIKQDKIEYAIKTRMGRIGIDNVDVSAMQPVKTNMLTGDYSYLKAIHEEYTMHTEITTTTDEDGNVQTETHTYWTWDEVDTQKQVTDDISFNGTVVKSDIVQLDAKRLKLTSDIVNLRQSTSSFLGFTFDSSDYIEDNYVFTDDNNRYSFYSVPAKFTAASVFAKATDTLEPMNSKIEIYDKSVKDVKDKKQSDVHIAIKHQLPVSFIIAIVLTIGLQVALYFINKQ